MIKSHSYEAPEFKVYQLYSEGTLCQSVEGVTINDLSYDGEELGC